MRPRLCLKCPGLVARAFCSSSRPWNPLRLGRQQQPHAKRTWPRRRALQETGRPENVRLRDEQKNNARSHVHGRHATCGQVPGRAATTGKAATDTKGMNRQANSAQQEVTSPHAQVERPPHPTKPRSPLCNLPHNINCALDLSSSYMAIPECHLYRRSAPLFRTALAPNAASHRRARKQ